MWINYPEWRPVCCPDWGVWQSRCICVCLQHWSPDSSSSGTSRHHWAADLLQWSHDQLQAARLWTGSGWCDEGKILLPNIYIYAFSRSFYPKFRLYILSVCVFPGNWTHNLCAANAMLYHWDMGTNNSHETLQNLSLFSEWGWLDVSMKKNK